MGSEGGAASRDGAEEPAGRDLGWGARLWRADDADTWERYPLSSVALTNLLTLAVASVSFAGMLPLGALAYVYLAGFLAYYLVLSRLLVCTRCSGYGTRCAEGWGLVVARLLPRARSPSSAGPVLAAVHWTAWFRVLPGLALFYLAVEEATAGHGSLAFFSRPALFMWAFIALQGAWSAWRARSCSHCAERATCAAAPWFEP